MRLLLGAGRRAGGGAPAGIIWNGSSDTPASSADWVRSGANLIATRPSGSGDALLRGSTPHAASKSFKVTVNALGTASDILIGMVTSSMATTSWAGNTGGIAYSSSGSTFKNAGAGAIVSVPTYGSPGDYIEFVVDGTGNSVTVKKNGTTVGTGAFDITGMGSLYPAVSTGNNGTQVTLDATNWV